MSLALARKYRPKSFASVAVQSHVSRTLQGAIARGRVAHGYLLCGPRGVGKTTLARVLAMALNCERRHTGADEGEPCGECTSCTRIWSGGASLDVVEIDAASNRGVDDARDLRERALYAPSGDDRYKVYIVDEAHMLTREAWNALLKILEEPPPRVVFVFATTEPQKIAQSASPVLSRLQRFDLKRIGPADIRQRLRDVLEAEGLQFEEHALAMLARAADGSMRDALSLADQVLSLGDGTLRADDVRDALGLVPEDEYLGLLRLIATRRAADVFPAVTKLADAGVDFGVLLGGLADTLRAQLAVVLGASPEEVSEQTRAVLAELRSSFVAADLIRMLAAIGELEPRFRRSSQQQLLFETMLVRFALIDRTVVLEELLRDLRGGESGGGSEIGAHRPASRQASPGGVSRASTPIDAAHSPARAAPVERVAPPARAASERSVERPVDRDVPLELNRVVERWDAIIARLRDAGRVALAAMLQRALPVSVTGRGVVLVEVDEPSTEGFAMLRQALDAAHAEVLAAMRAEVPGAERVSLRQAARADGPPPKRLTVESIRDDRLASLRKRDPGLDAAVDALDLELID